MGGVYGGWGGDGKETGKRVADTLRVGRDRHGHCESVMAKALGLDACKAPEKLSGQEGLRDDYSSEAAS